MCYERSSEDSAAGFTYLILRRENPLGLIKIKKTEANKYWRAYGGEVHQSNQDLDSLLEICSSYHVVEEDTDFEFIYVPKCTYNPQGMYCKGCKLFQQWGICHHILAVSHIYEHIDLKQLSKELPVRAPKKGRPKRYGCLERVPDTEQEDSDPDPDFEAEDSDPDWATDEEGYDSI